jgi:hypothetical protein
MKSHVAMLSIALVAATAPTHVDAYYADVHYALTYYVARVVGCTPAQAYRLASADVSVDYSPPTEPVQGIWPTRENQVPRARFHAFRDETRFERSIGDNEQGPQADAAIKQQGVKLLAAGIEAKNPGVFLHFYQDALPHARYGSRGGHWVDTLNTPTITPGGWPPITPLNLEMLFQQLAMGSTTDWLSLQNERDPNANAKLLHDTAEIINSTMHKMYSVGAGVQRPCLRPLPPAGEYLPVLQALRVANPYPKQLFPYDLQFVKRLYDLRRKTDKTPEEIRQEQDLAARYGKHTDGPNVEAARALLNAAMKQRGMSDDIPDRVNRFDFDEEGAVKGPTDPWVMVASLRVTVTGASGAPGQAAAPVTVTVKVPQLQSAEPEYAIDRASSAGQPVEFTRLPVGKLILEVSRAGGAAVRHEVTLDRVNNEATVNLGTGAVPWRYR